jgi:hypothetical protein
VLETAIMLVGSLIYCRLALDLDRR